MNDKTAVRWKRESLSGWKPTIMVSAYFSITTDTPQTKLKTLVDNYNSSDVLIGCDSNAHHSLWGHKDCNKMEVRI